MPRHVSVLSTTLVLLAALPSAFCARTTAPPPSPTPTNTPPNVTRVEQLGYINDKAFNPSIYRDGGGGGYINGYHVIGFSDSYTVKNLNGTGSTAVMGPPNGTETSFVHNTYVYFGYNNASDPTNLFDFGGVVNNKTGQRAFLPSTLRPQTNETQAVSGFPAAFWPTSNIVALSTGYQGMQVVGVYNEANLSILYNTLVVVDVQPPTSPLVAPGKNVNIARMVPRLFYENENLFGTFALYKPQFAFEPADPNIYFFAANKNGIKVARVNSADKYYRHFYTYWNGTAWSIEQPAKEDTASNIINWNYVNPFNNQTYGPGTGDIFYSPYFRTYTAIFQGDGILSNFYISTSLSGTITGPWSDPELLLEVDTDPMCEIYAPNYELNYQGHAYPAWDVTGESVLLSWSACNAWVRMAKVSFV